MLSRLWNSAPNLVALIVNVIALTPNALTVYMALRGNYTWGDWEISLVCGSINVTSFVWIVWRTRSRIEERKRLEAETEDLKRVIDDMSNRFWHHFIPVDESEERDDLQELRREALECARRRFEVSSPFVPEMFPLEDTYPLERDALEFGIRFLKGIVRELEQLEKGMFTLRLAWGKRMMVEIGAGSLFAEQQASTRRFTRREKEIFDYLLGSREVAEDIWKRICKVEGGGAHADPEDWRRLEMHWSLSSEALANRLTALPPGDN